MSITLQATPLDATFHPDAGMIGSSLRRHGTELLGQRQGLEAYRMSASTFGIPLLHPWANRLSRDGYAVAGVTVDLEAGDAPVKRDPGGLPIHGLAAASPYWRVASCDDERTAAVLDWAEHDELMAGFPFPHELRMEVALDAGGLTVTTTLTATGDVAVPVAYGFHPYLALPGVAREHYEITLPVTRQAVLDERGIPTGAQDDVTIAPANLGERTFDDLFVGLAGDRPEFVAEGGGRRLGVRFEEGFPFAQVYAPPREAFVCFEPMTAPTNALISGEGLRTVAPGSRDTTRFTITVA